MTRRAKRFPGTDRRRRTVAVGHEAGGSPDDLLAVSVRTREGRDTPSGVDTADSRARCRGKRASETPARTRLAKARSGWAQRQPRGDRGPSRTGSGRRRVHSARVARSCEVEATASRRSACRNSGLPSSALGRARCESGPPAAAVPSASPPRSKRVRPSTTTTPACSSRFRWSRTRRPVRVRGGAICGAESHVRRRMT